MQEMNEVAPIASTSATLLSSMMTAPGLTETLLGNFPEGDRPHLENNKKDVEHKKGREKRTRDEVEGDSDDEDDEMVVNTQTLGKSKSEEDFWRQLSDWPDTGRGKNYHGMHHEWIRFLGTSFKNLKEENKRLAEKNQKLTSELRDLTARVAQLEKAPIPTVSSTASPSYASVAAGNASTEAELVIINKVMIDMKKKESTQRNIIITGLGEGDENSAIEKEEEERKVKDLLGKLKIDPGKVKRRARLRKRGVQRIPEKPSPLLIELADKELVETALANSKALRGAGEFARVYVNRDLTESERSFEAELRRKRKAENDKLPNVDSRGRRFGIDESTGKAFFYRIERNGRLTKFFFDKQQ